MHVENSWIDKNVRKSESNMQTNALEHVQQDVEGVGVCLCVCV